MIMRSLWTALSLSASGMALSSASMRRPRALHHSSCWAWVAEGKAVSEFSAEVPDVEWARSRGLTCLLVPLDMDRECQVLLLVSSFQA